MLLLLLWLLKRDSAKEILKNFVFSLCAQWRMTYWCRKSQGGRCQRGRNHSGRDKYWLLVHWCDCWTGRGHRIPPQIWIWRSQGCKLDERERKIKGTIRTKQQKHVTYLRRQAAVTSVAQQKLHLFSIGGAQYLRRKCWYVREKWQRISSYLYICICSFIFALSTRWR